MKGENKFCLTFAGAVGNSKTPISNYLSTRLLLPVFNNDAIRTEVIEDLGVLDSKEYLKRRDLRLEEIIKSGNSFIYDASVDRAWKKLKEKLTLFSYDFFIVSLDLSKELLTKLYQSKRYLIALKRIDELIQDHNNFLDQYLKDVGLQIKDGDFINRMQISYSGVKNYLERKNNIR